MSGWRRRQAAGRIVHALATFGAPMQEVNEGDFIGREAFIANKRAIGRAKDISDIEGL